MSALHEWAIAWRIPVAALQDLQTRLGLLTPAFSPATPGYGKTEAYSQSAIRLEAGQKDILLFRNNVGALKDKAGRLIRYGLANDSADMNDVIKSADLIGIRKVLITPQHVGYYIGQFVSREAKEPGWQYTGADREVAQLAWLNMILAHGGDAAFATGAGTL